MHDATRTRAQQWHGGLGERDDTEEVHVEHPAPVVFGQITKGSINATLHIPHQIRKHANHMQALVE